MSLIIVSIFQEVSLHHILKRLSGLRMAGLTQQSATTFLCSETNEEGISFWLLHLPPLSYSE